MRGRSRYSVANPRMLPETSRLFEVAITVRGAERIAGIAFEVVFLVRGPRCERPFGHVGRVVRLHHVC